MFIVLVGISLHDNNSHDLYRVITHSLFLLTKLRCNVRTIRIETRRYENVNENRLCLLWNNNTFEIEEHVILKCWAYNNIQTDLFTSAESTHPNYDNLTDSDKRSLIFANADMFSNSAKACHENK